MEWVPPPPLTVTASPPVATSDGEVLTPYLGEGDEGGNGGGGSEGGDSSGGGDAGGGGVVVVGDGEPLMAVEPDWSVYPYCNVPLDQSLYNVTWTTMGSAVVRIPPPIPPDAPMDSLVPLVLWSNSILVALALLAVVLRCWSRIKCVGSMYREDHLATMSWVFSFITSFFVCWSTRLGLGYRWYNIPKMDEGLMSSAPVPAVYLMVVTYPPALVCIKASLLLFYLRLTSAMQNGFRLSIKLILAFVIVSGILNMALLMFPCRNPVSASWNMRNMTCATKCVDVQGVFLSTAVLNLISDLLIIAIPIKMLWGIRLARRAKVQVYIVFGLGGIVCVVSVIRLVYVHLADPARSGIDFLYIGGFSALWSAIELNVSIICACLPAIKPLLAMWWPTVFSHIHPRDLPGGSPPGGRRYSPGNNKSPSPAIDAMGMDDIPTFGGSGGRRPIRPPGYSLRSLFSTTVAGPNNSSSSSSSNTKPTTTHIYRGDLDGCSTHEFDNELTPHPSRRNNAPMGYRGTVEAAASASEERMIGPTSCFADLEVGMYSGIDRSGEKGDCSGGGGGGGAGAGAGGAELGTACSITKTTEVRVNVNERGKRVRENEGMRRVADVKRKENGGGLFTWPGRG